MTGPRTLLHVFPQFTTGGPQVRFAQLANHFGARYRHRIVSMSGATGALARVDPGIDAAMVPARFRKQETVGNLLSFRRVLKEMRPDLLVTSNWGAIEWAMANFDHFVSHLHLEDGFGPEEADRQLTRRVWTRRLVLRRSAVLLPSRKLVALARDVWKLPPRHLHYVPNGIDCTRFNIPPDAELTAKYGLARDRPVVGTVGGLRREKNLFRLLDSFGLVLQKWPVQLVFVGDGPLLPELKAYAAERGLGDSVIFTGICSTPERLLPAFSVFALSSDTEQMPLSILEAMAASRPIASTDVGDVRDMLAEENRPFVVPRDAGRLAESILALLDNPKRAQEIGRANRDRAVSVYDEGAMFAAYRRLFDGDLRSPGGVA